MRRVGVILLNLGGPEKIEDVRPFLRNLFMDPEIIRIPLPGPIRALFPRRAFAEFVSRRRAPQVIPNYEEIGGGSPILARSREQAEALEKELNSRGIAGLEFVVRLGMRYWEPFTADTMEEFKRAGIRDVFLLPLYPQYSRTTSGSSFKEFRDLNRDRFRYFFHVESIKEYFDHPRYIGAINDRINETLIEKFDEEQRREVTILFSAHGTPMYDVEEGDPYSFQIRDTVHEVMKARGNDHPHQLSFQSRVGPVKWLEPYTEDKLKEMGEAGTKTVLVVPVAFVTDHIETLHELDIELREVAEEAGVRKYEVMNALNDHPEYIGALADIVQERYDR